MLLLTFTAGANCYAVDVARVVEVVPRVELRHCSSCAPISWPELLGLSRHGRSGRRSGCPARCPSVARIGSVPRIILVDVQPRRIPSTCSVVDTILADDGSAREVLDPTPESGSPGTRSPSMSAT